MGKRVKEGNLIKKERKTREKIERKKREKERQKKREKERQKEEGEERRQKKEKRVFELLDLFAPGRWNLLLAAVLAPRFQTRKREKNQRTNERLKFQIVKEINGRMQK
jgi:hypothetical protein